MRGRTALVAAAALAAIVALVLVVVALDGRQGQVDGPGPVQTAPEDDDPERYWTPERMRDAEPYPMPTAAPNES